MEYVILDKFPLGLVLDDDTGGVAVFDTIEEAEVVTKEEAIKARLEGELKYFGKYKSKVLNNEIN